MQLFKALEKSKCRDAKQHLARTRIDARVRWIASGAESREKRYINVASGPSGCAEMDLHASFRHTPFWASVGHVAPLGILLYAEARAGCGPSTRSSASSRRPRSRAACPSTYARPWAARHFMTRSRPIGCPHVHGRGWHPLPPRRAAYIKHSIGQHIHGISFASKAHGISHPKPQTPIAASVRPPTYNTSPPPNGTRSALHPSTPHPSQLPLLPCSTDLLTGPMWAALRRGASGLHVFGTHPTLPGFVLLVRVRYNLIPNRYLYNSGCHGMSNSGSPMSIYNSGSPMSIYNSGPMSR